MRTGLPAGTVTFMFTDIEGSTALLHELGPTPYAQALQEHRELVRSACARHGGVEVDTQGDALFLAFPTAPEAVAAAHEAQLALVGSRVRIRVGLHTGTPLLTEEGYVGEDVHLGARIAAVAHGGQVLVSAATRAGISDDVAVTDLGEHRLKDFQDPVQIFQLGTATFPPLRTVSNTNLPRPASALLGRAAEVAEVVALVRGGSRLITLTGPGGTGKSRLAIDIGSELVAEMKAGVFWIGLAPLRDATLVVPTIAQAIGARGDLAVAIGERQLLLLLDNFEHLVDAAADVKALIESCPNLTVLVTSRELLRVRGEVQFAVPPLASTDATDLFCVRSGCERTPEVVELCRRLDHLPLAVELAAARARVLSPGQILDRIGHRLDLLKGGRGTDARQQTLRATIDWSYALLSPEEQQLFASLSVFAGGATLEAAESVIGADIDVLAALLDKSLLRNADGRFWMLDTIRQYAMEQLEASGQRDAAGLAHAQHFLQLAEQLEPQLLGVKPRDALDRLEAEVDNLRAALDWLEQRGDTQTCLRMAGALWEFWCLRSHYTEGLTRLERLLDADPAPTRARAKALNGAAHLAEAGGGDSGWVEQAISANRQVGDVWGLAFAQHEAGLLLAQRGEFAACLPIMEECVGRWRQIGDEHRELQAIRIVAWAADELGDPGRFQRLHEEIVQRAQQIGDDEGLAWSLSVLAGIATREGRPVEAVTLLRRADEVQQRVADPASECLICARLAVAVSGAGDMRLAARIFGLADQLRAAADFTYPEWFLKLVQPAEAAIRQALDGETVAAEAELGRLMSRAEAFDAATAAATVQAASR